MTRIIAIAGAADVDSAPAPRPASRVREVWLDSAKGIGIMLVVLGHALAGLIDSPIGNRVAAFRLIALFVYSFHVPLFFFLAGLLVTGRLRRGRRRFAADIGRGLLLPYLLWSVVQYSILYAAGGLVNQPAKTYWPAIASLPWRPIAQFWFLWALLLLHAASLLIGPRLGPRAFLALLVAARLAIPILPLSLMVGRTLLLAPFYAFGVWLGLDGARRLLQRCGVGLRTVISVVAIGATPAACGAAIAADQAGFFGFNATQIALLGWSAPMIPSALVAIAAVLIVADSARGRAAALLSAVGRASMAIFLLHILFTAGTRIVAVRLGLGGDPRLIALLATLGGIGGPMMVRSVARRAGLAMLPGLG